MIKKPFWFIVTYLFLCSCDNRIIEEVHVFEIFELTLEAHESYDNPYMEVECWIELSGPGVGKKIYGFWNGEREFVFRLVATLPGSMVLDQPFQPG